MPRKATELTVRATNRPDATSEHRSLETNTIKIMSRSIEMVRKDTEHMEELSVHWRHLAVRFHEIQALAPCSGDVEAGQIVALMGPTGAGKTSLLNALARRGPAAMLGSRPSCGWLDHRAVTGRARVRSSAWQPGCTSASVVSVSIAGFMPACGRRASRND